MFCNTVYKIEIHFLFKIIIFFFFVLQIFIPKCVSLTGGLPPERLRNSSFDDFFYYFRIKSIGSKLSQHKTRTACIARNFVELNFLTNN